MIAVIIAVSVVIFILLACFAISLYSYIFAFYSSEKGKKKVLKLPHTEQYAKVKEKTDLLLHEINELPYEQVFIDSFDGTLLAARYYHISDDAPLQIQFHGYRGSALRDFLDGEAIACVYQGDFSGDSVSFRGGQTLRIVRYQEDIPVQGDLILTSTSSMALVVPDLAYAVKGLDRIADFNGDPVVTYAWQYNFDTGLDGEGQIALCQYLSERFRNPVEDDGTIWTAKYGDAVRYRYLESQEEEREDFYGMFGVLFYIGVLLSIVFTIAAVLIIYYKQISEGYEDQARFEVMQKVGMTKREIRRSINSQLLTVFFLPLVFAALHLTFAFPLIQKILLAFGLDNVRLFAVTTAVCLALFALFYTVVYRLTANAYYAIVSGAREEDR